MNRHRWIGWLTAIILALALLAPAVGTVGAEEGDDDLLLTEVTTTGIEDTVLDETAPPETGELPDGTPVELQGDSTGEEMDDPVEDTGSPAELEDSSDTAALGLEEETILSETADEEEASEVDLLVEKESDVSGSIKVFFEDQYGDPIVGAGFNLYEEIDGVCATLLASQVTDVNGVIIFVGIDPAATYCVVVTSVPAGYENITGGWVVTPADTDEDLSPLDAVLYLGAAKLGGGEMDVGKVTILKYYCEASGPEYQRVLFDLFEYDLDSVAAASESSLDCSPGWAKFWIEPVGKGQGFLAETDSGTGSDEITGLPPGQYEITEIAPWESGTFVFEVFKNGVTTIAVQNFYYEGEAGEGSLEIQKYFCPDKSAWTEFIVDEVAAAHKECEPGKASFMLFPYFSGEGIPFKTDHHGYALIEEVPEGTHLLMEQGTEATFAVTIVDGQTTSVVVRNHYVPDHPHDGGHKPPVTEPDKEPAGGVVVEELPNTGTGSTADENAMAMVASSLVALIVIAFLRVRPLRFDR